MYDEKHKQWTFRVEHFTRYKFNFDEAAHEQDDQEVLSRAQPPV
jgi:hypothetical protein